MSNNLSPVILALGLMAAIRPVIGATIYVAAIGGDDTHTGLGDWNNAVATISQGVAKATGFYTDIVLVSNGTYNLAATVNVTNGITVRGFSGRDQTFVSGGGTIRCFYVNNGGILDGLTISNGYNGVSLSGGGGAYIDKTGYVYNCTFTNNKANYYGGGLYINTNGLVTNGLFIGNAATNGLGGSDGYGHGGGIYIAAQGVASNCEFRLNIAGSPNRNGGGGVYAAGGGTVYDSHFYTNTAYCYGGGARVQYLYNCTFISNWAGQGGGGAYVLTFASNCIFTYNFAPNASIYGGGCYVAAGASLVNCTNISYNVADRGGGVHLTSSTGAYLQVFSNTASQGGGVYIVNGLLSNSVVYGHTNEYGGGLYCDGNGIRVVDCIISNNSSRNGGGGIYWYFYASAGNSGLLEGCSIIGNSNRFAAVVGGGGFCCKNNGYGNVPIRRCIFAYNTAGTGGGIYNAFNTGQVENCLIYSNSGGTSGSGVYLASGSTSLLVNCTIVSNSAPDGAGIYATGTGNRVINTIVYGNNPMLYGTNAVAFTNCCLTTTNGLFGSGNFTNAPQFKAP